MNKYNFMWMEKMTLIVFQDNTILIVNKVCIYLYLASNTSCVHAIGRSKLFSALYLIHCLSLF